MLSLRRGRVVVAHPPEPRGWQELRVDVDGEMRTTQADIGLVGESRVGDEVVINVAGVELALGSGGFDLVHVNLTRGLGHPPDPGAAVLKLNYTSLQHGVVPVEGDGLGRRLDAPVAVALLHGHLAPVAWAFARRAPGARLGYVQTAGGALPGALSATVPELTDRGLLVDHVTAGPAHGGRREAVTVAGALHFGLGEAGWDAAVCAPGPGILGSGSALGHGGLQGVDSLHAALGLGCRALLVPRMSAADPRDRHRGLSHHTTSVLDLLLGPVRVALAPGERPADERHEWHKGAADLDGYRASGLPARTMGRSLDEDRLFFAAGLAGGDVLADMVRAA